MAALNTNSCKSNWAVTTPISVGYICLFLLIFVIGFWSIITHISGAVIATGTVHATVKRLAIQHPIGGVIAQINVTNSDRVKSGDILLQFDSKQLNSELVIIETQYFELLARKALSIAERDHQESIAFDDELISNSNSDKDLRALMDSHVGYYTARKSSLDAEQAQFSKQKIQLRAQIKGVEAQNAAYKTQLNYIEIELADTQALLNKGLTHKPRVLALQREKARIIGQIGRLSADRGRLNAEITGLDIQTLRLDNKYHERATKNLRDIGPRLYEITEIRASIVEKLSLLDVRAPLSGTVHGNQTFALKSVVQPAETIFYIIPTEQPVIIQAKINVMHADQIRIGQEATLNFIALSLPKPLNIPAKVTKLSADTFTDPITGHKYYQAELIPNDAAIIQFDHFQVLHGMPVEVFFKTTSRTAFSYFINPIANYFNKAFREQ